MTAEKPPSPNASRMLHAPAEQASAAARAVQASDAWTFTWRELPPSVLGFVHPVSRQLIEQAFRFQQDGENEWRIAVILAHAACDIQTRDTLDHLIKVRQLGHLRDSLLGPLGKQLSLSRPQVRALYISLSGGDDPTAATWWKDSCVSVERRNFVAHAGQHVTKSEAGQSYESCRLLVEHLLRVVVDAELAAKIAAELAAKP